jgi:hypothetical protein
LVKNHQLGQSTMSIPWATPTPLGTACGAGGGGLIRFGKKTAGVSTICSLTIENGGLTIQNGDVELNESPYLGNLTIFNN